MATLWDCSELEQALKSDGPEFEMSCCVPRGKLFNLSQPSSSARWEQQPLPHGADPVAKLLAPEHKALNQQKQTLTEDKGNPTVRRTFIHLWMKEWMDGWLGDGWSLPIGKHWGTCKPFQLGVHWVPVLCHPVGSWSLRGGHSACK